MLISLVTDAFHLARLFEDTRFRSVRVPPKNADADFCGLNIRRISTSIFTAISSQFQNCRFSLHRQLRLPLESQFQRATSRLLFLSDLSHFRCHTSHRRSTRTPSSITASIAWCPVTSTCTKTSRAPSTSCRRRSSRQEVRKKTISKEQLIGIVCGSAAGFFLILALIVFIIQRKNRTIDNYNEIDFFLSESGNVSGEETHKTEEIIKKVFVPRPFSI